MSIDRGNRQIFKTWANTIGSLISSPSSYYLHKQVPMFLTSMLHSHSLQPVRATIPLRTSESQRSDLNAGFKYFTVFYLCGCAGKNNHVQIVSLQKFSNVTPPCPGYIQIIVTSSLFIERSIRFHLQLLGIVYSYKCLIV